MSHNEQFQHLKIQLETIQAATSNFSPESCIGHGGFGKVYKGELVHSTGEVAFKRLDRSFGQGDTEFWKEVTTLSFYRHKNIVSLLGYCDDRGEKILVYEYLSKKSLDSYLASNDLTWVQRLKICVGAAHGLAYLHQPGDGVRLLHRDIKSSNILLDNDWNAKISDFGLCKLASANILTLQVTRPVGTPWYIDPVYHELGFLTKESDVYSFGVVLFELLCGRLCFGNRDLRPLVALVLEYYKQNKISELVYSNIKDEIKESCLELFADIAYQCLSRDRKNRPLMTHIVSTLEKALVIQENDDEEGIVNVKVVGSRKKYDLVGLTKKYDYFVLSIDSDGRFSKANLNEESNLYVKDVHRQLLHITVYMIISENKYGVRGKGKMRLTDLTPEIAQTFEVPIYNPDSEKHKGDINVEVVYKPSKGINHLINPVQMTPSIGTSNPVQKAPIQTMGFRRLINRVQKTPPNGGGLLVVIIHSAKFVDALNVITSSVSLRFCGKSRHTKMIYERNPLWLEEFTFMLEQPPTDEILHLELINHDSWWGRLLPKEWGSQRWVDISLADVVNKKRTDQLYSLNSSKRFPFVADLPDASLQVELHWRTSD